MIKDNIKWWLVGVGVVILLVALFNKPSQPVSDAPESATTSQATQVKSQTSTKTSVPKATTKPTYSYPGVPTPAEPIYTGTVKVYPQTLKQLMASGRGQKCTFTDSNSRGENIEGRVYVAGNSVRGEMTVYLVGKTEEVKEIIVGQDVYVWTNISKPGSQSTLAMSSSPTASFAVNGINADKALEYRCDPWTVDPNSFSLPANITFNKI